MRRLAAAALALLALLPAPWAAAQEFCGADGDACCCADPARPVGAAIEAEDRCCCEVSPRDEAPAEPSLPRDFSPARAEIAGAVGTFPLILPPEPVNPSPFRKTASARPRGPPGPLYLRHHAFLC